MLKKDAPEVHVSCLVKEEIATIDKRRRAHAQDRSLGRNWARQRGNMGKQIKGVISFYSPTPLAATLQPPRSARHKLNSVSDRRPAASSRPPGNNEPGSSQSSGGATDCSGSQESLVAFEKATVALTAIERSVGVRWGVVGSRAGSHLSKWVMGECFFFLPSEAAKEKGSFWIF